MKILLDQNNVAQFLDSSFTVTENGVVFSDGLVCSYLNTTNTKTIDVEPPEHLIGGAYQWVDDSWVCINPDFVNETLAAKKESINSQQRKNRALAYKEESDPIFFLVQRGEATNEEWLAKIEQIKLRYPYQE